MAVVDFFWCGWMDVGGVWGEGKKRGVLCWMGYFLERGRDGVLVVVLDGRVWNRNVLVAGAATATATAGRNSKNYRSLTIIIRVHDISYIVRSWGR